MGPQILHATTIALDGRGVLILGASGRGKSALALHLMALGADLVADDRTILTRVGDCIIATCPPAIRGRIEARGFGLLNATPRTEATLALVIDLDGEDRSRLPQERRTTLLDCPLDLAFGPVTPHFPAAILQYLRCGRATD